jgi:pentose-5-phosphate-3-epimerase
MDEGITPVDLLNAYNDGLGDGLVAATAIMGGGSQKFIQEWHERIKAVRKEYRALAKGPDQK